jgi:DNA-binding transcriptional MerR regulator
MYARFLSTVLTLSMLFISPVAGLNYFVDPYGYFRTDFRKQKTEPNQQLVKMKYIIENPTKYDCFIFGSSRCGNMDPKKIPDRKAYNMTYSEGLPAEWLANIKTMLEHGVTVKTIIICLDDFSFRLNPADHVNQWMRLAYRENMQPIYWRYVLRIPQPEVIKPYFDKEPSQVFFDIYDSGRPLHPQVDEAIEKDPEKHITDSKFWVPMKHEEERIAPTIEEIKQIKTLTDQNKIELIMVMNPIHITTYMGNNREELYRFQQELVKITPFYDFSPPSRVTTNNYYFYETSHYRTLVGDWMIARIYGLDNKDLFGDFGTYVTVDNISIQIKHAEQTAKELSN